MRREWGMCDYEFLNHMRHELARMGTGNEGSEGVFAFHSISFWPPLCVLLFLRKYFQAPTWLLNEYSVWWFNSTAGISCHEAVLSMMLIAHRLKQETRSSGLESLTLQTLRLKRCPLLCHSLLYRSLTFYTYLSKPGLLFLGYTFLLQDENFLFHLTIDSF